MKGMNSQKVTISLSDEMLSYADSYKKTHGLNRSEVFVLALQRLREQELAEGYQAMARDQDALNDPWLDSGLDETLSESKA
jgi:hypothetical protein